MMKNEVTILGGAMFSKGHKIQQLSFQVPTNGKTNTGIKLKLQGEGRGCHIAGTQNILKKHVLKYMAIQIGGMNSR